jgi:hypothetical protein
MEKEPGVVVYRTRAVEGAFMDWIPEAREIESFVGQIMLSDAVLSNGSTVLLDACILGKPAISIALGGATRRARTMRRNMSYDHLRMAAETGAFPVCENVASAIAEIDRALKFPRERADGRSEFAVRLLGNVLESSTARIVRAVREVAGVG